MKQTLQLKLTQHLTLTPQLQQSIRLLQLSTLELNAEVDRMLQENPLLEREDGDEDAPPAEFPLAGTAPGPVTTERVTLTGEPFGTKVKTSLDVVLHSSYVPYSDRLRWAETPMAWVTVASKVTGALVLKV